MKIELWSDFACPFCYIGKKRFEEALSQFKHKNKVSVIYKAYQLNPDAPKVMKGSAYEAFAKGHHMTVAQAKERFKMFTQNAKAVGLTYNYDIIQMTNTFDAHRLAKWSNQFGKEEVITSLLMKAYFTDGVNLADQESLIKLASEVGLNPKEAREVLLSNQFADQVNNEISEGRQIGVQGVPFFVLNRKYGVSGAQQTEYFLNALNQIWQEENPLQPLGSQDDTQACDHEECGF
jgi:predicted DsbA family dithiol-disulfide isomerase